MKNKVIVIIITALFLGLSLWNLLGVKGDYSESERRVLAKFPEISLANVMSGDFADEFEEYLVDHFPKRDTWRGMKAYAKTKILSQKDNNGLYEAEGHLSKIEYPMNMYMLEHATEVFAKVNERYLNTGNHVYLAVISDKNRYIARRNNYISLDYKKLSGIVSEKMAFADYIEIDDLLEADDYYYTDSHWKQEKIIDVAERILREMNAGTGKQNQYEEHDLKRPFYGVYVGQSALKCEPDTITFLSDDMIDHMEVTGADAVYDMEKAEGKDPYEMFLSGNQPIVTINNPLQNNGKRLIVFRDSFGSSIAPLLAEGYSETVLIDLRYISSDMIGQFVEFDEADVLFLYSTMLLNNSLSIK